MPLRLGGEAVGEVVAAAHRLAEHDPRDRQRLGHQRAHVGQAALLLGGDPAAELADLARHPHRRRHEEQRDQRQPPVQDAHRHDRADHGRDVRGDRRGGGRDDVVQAADVVGDARLHLAGAGAREERERHLLQVVVDRGAQVVHHPLADGVGEVGLPDARRLGDERDADHPEHGLGRAPCRCAPTSPSSSAALDQERVEHADRRPTTTIITEHDREPPPVGPEQAQDPPAVALAGRIHQLRRLLSRAAELPHRARRRRRRASLPYRVHHCSLHSMMTRRESAASTVAERLTNVCCS